MEESQPPYVWNKALAPKIPNRKDLLLKELSPTMNETALKTMGKEELRHMFVKAVRGERHPNDCTHRMGSMTLGELQERVEAHGLPTGQGLKAATKGLLQNMLRTHWQEQCALADFEAAGAAGATEHWEVVSEPAESLDTTSVSAGFDKAHQQMVLAMAHVFEHAGKNATQLPAIHSAYKTFDDFVAIMKKLAAD